jgi:hypothetical protein
MIDLLVAVGLVCVHGSTGTDRKNHRWNHVRRAEMAQVLQRFGLTVVLGPAEGIAL